MGIQGIQVIWGYSTWDRGIQGYILYGDTIKGYRGYLGYRDAGILGICMGIQGYLGIQGILEIL